MNRRIRRRMLVILAVTVLCLWRVTAYPGLVPSKDRLRENVKLGLDLRGGTHLVLQVVTDDAIRGETDRAIETIRQELNKRNIVFRQLTRTQENTFEVVGVDPAKDSDVRAVLNEQFRDWELISTSTVAANTYCRATVACYLGVSRFCHPLSGMPRALRRSTTSFNK